MNTEIKNNMKIITADEGMVITNWDGENILDFSYCKIIYAPVNLNTDSYREITQDEAEELIEKQMIEFEKMERMNR